MTYIHTKPHASQQMFQESLVESCKRLQPTTVHLKPRTDKTSQEIMGTYVAIHNVLAWMYVLSVGGAVFGKGFGGDSYFFVRNSNTKDSPDFPGLLR